MKTVVVAREAATTSLRYSRDNDMILNTDFLQSLPLLMGNADPVHYAQFLPGVQTSSELDAGLHIQGSDNTHNLFTIQGTPIYNPSHLLGFFSVYNEAHFGDMALSSSPMHGRSAARLGGTLTMSLHTEHPDSLNGSASIGLMSSQGTLRLPLGRKSSLTLSARATYINLLYSQWMRDDEYALRYSFYDANLTWLYTPTHRDRIWLDAFFSRDKALTEHHNFVAENHLSWGNHAASLHWQHSWSDNLSFEHNLYNTRYHNSFDRVFPSNSYILPSSIMDYGYKGQVDWLRWKFGLELACHDLQEQVGYEQGDFTTTYGKTPSHQYTGELAVTADYEQPLASWLSLDLGLRGSAYLDAERDWHKALDPSVRLLYYQGDWRLTASYALRHQYLYLTGPTSMGLPVEYWASCSRRMPAQWAHCADVGIVRFFNKGRYRVSADLWYKRLYNQYEADGELLGVLAPDYYQPDHVLRGHGHNYGFSLMVQKCAGPVVGWVSYTYSRAMRRFDHPDYPDLYHATHERPHELNALLTWTINPRWSVSTTYVLASGTPYTAASYFYFINGQMMVEYGKYNGERTSFYNRLDLSANYHFRPTRHIADHGLNFSLYNATFSNNEMAQTLKIKDKEYAYSRLSFVKFPLPSVSYFIRF